MLYASWYPAINCLVEIFFALSIFSGNNVFFLVLEAVMALTKPQNMAGDDEAFFEFVRGAKRNGIARKVKQADLGDNMDIGRIENPMDKDFKRLKRYETALEILKDDGVTRVTP